MPGSGAVITVENVTQMTELGRWGRGVITDIDLSADGQWVAVASGSGVYIHDIHDLSAKPTAIETTGNVTAVSISPTGDKVALVTWGEELQVWQLEPPELLFEGNEVKWVQFSPNGHVLGITKRTIRNNQIRETIELWDSRNGMVLASFRPGYEFNPRIEFSPTGSRVAIWSQSDDKVDIYGLEADYSLEETRQAVLHREDGLDYYQPTVSDVVFLTEDELRFLIVEILDYTFVTGRIEVQDADNNNTFFSADGIPSLTGATKYVCNEPVVYWDAPEPPTPDHLAISPDKQIAAMIYEGPGYGGDFGKYTSLRFHRVASGNLLYAIEERVVDIELSPDGQTWVAGLQDGRLQIRRLSDGTVLESVDAYESPILQLAVSPDNQWVGATYVDEVKIYHRADGTLRHRFPATSIAFAPDSQSFALAYLDGHIELRNFTDGNVINTTIAHQDRVTAVSYLPSGELLSAGFDCNLIRWQTPALTPVGALENFTVEGMETGEQVPVRVREFLVMPDGQSVIGLFYGGDFGVWSMQDGQLVRTPDPDYENATNVRAVSFDGTLLAVPDGRVPEPWDDAITFIETEAEVAGF